MNCPACLRPFKSHSVVSRHGAGLTLDDLSPDEDDWSICSWCATLLVFTSPTSLRVLRGDELLTSVTLERRTMLLRAQALIREFRGLDN